ncbi:endolytic transglycosylase MltG [Patescibacteria group bacterium]|nr:endolytic transglycosylase MltG [Patescibacteria group bacterium]
MNPRVEQRGLLSLRILVVLGGILVFILFLGYFFYGLQPSATTGSSTVFEIKSGESFREIGARLSQDDLIKSITVFKLYSLLTGQAGHFQPGAYVLSGTMSVPQIVGAFTSGGANVTNVTIVEGSTLKDVDAALFAAHVLPAGALEKFDLSSLKANYPFLANATSLEGFLFPDTYQFDLNSTPEAVVARFLDDFKQKVWPTLQSDKNWYQTLTLASYLEREVKTDADRKLVAGIILKRLAIKMPFQIDATVSYAKCAGTWQTCPNLTLERSDFKIDSPYNTYVRLGFTPTPIGNPGLQAVQDAENPTKSPYLYYLTDPKTGTTIFSKTLSEQNQNQARYF